MDPSVYKRRMEEKYQKNGIKRLRPWYSSDEETIIEFDKTKGEIFL